MACAARSTEAQPQRTAGTLDEVVRRIEDGGGKALAVPTNLADQEQVIAMVETTAQHFGALHILVNNAAITFVGDLEMPLHRHDLVMEVDLSSPDPRDEASGPHMRAAGRRPRGQRVLLSSHASHPGTDDIRHRQDRSGALHP